ncbi:MAG: DNA-3-methyladenine glycosylase [Myxococcota bacterium]
MPERRAPRAWGRKLEASFYRREVLDVAPDLLGRILIHDHTEGLTAGRIVEVEAYRGPEDQAAHSKNWRKTPRTEVMWGPGARAYMFLLYGIHWAFNLVTGEEGQPHAVLVRAVEPMAGFELMAERRGMASSRRELTNGPGKLCAALGLDRRHYGADLGGRALYVREGGVPLASQVGVSPRINIDYAGAWVDKPWRWYLRGNRYVSVKPRD